jgi:signal transduction histidine kinase
MMLNSPILKNAWKDAIPALEEYSSSHEDFYMAGFKLQEMKQVVPSLLEGISEGVNRIRDIVNGLKDYARQDKIVCLDENVNINQVVEKAVSLLSSMIKSSALNFKLDLDPDIKELKGNFQRFEQIVINLVQNACQVLEDSGSGFLLIRTEMENGWVALIVEDDGKGIPNEDMPYVSDPFFSSKRDSGGTGLGLAIVKVIVNEFGGQMEIKSQEGSGTKVKVVLPVAEDK